MRVRRPLSKLAVGVVAAASLVGAAGCGESEIDATKVEEAIQADLEGQGLGSRVESVECPEGEPSETGNRFDCTVTETNGATGDVPVEVTDGEEGNVAFGTEAQ